MPRLALHLLPLILLVLGYHYGTLAALLLVAIPYIKTKRLTIELLDVKENNPKDGATIIKIETKRRFWRRLTFLGQELKSH